MIAEITVEEGRLPPDRTISRVICGRAPDVRLYTGTPRDNSSGAEFPEAKMIWSESSPDWKTAIGAIEPDQEATRFARPADILPLRLEQLATTHDDVQQLIELEQQAIVQWSFVPIDAIVRTEAAVDEDDDDLAFLARSGKKSRQVIPYAIQHLRQTRPCWSWWRTYWREKTRFRCGGAQVFVGKPQLNSELLNDLSCCEVILAPHITRRGPNGLFVIERGSDHPVRRLFSSRLAYCLFEDRGPMTSIMRRWSHKAQAIQLFASLEAAAEAARELEDRDIKAEVVCLAANDLLQVLSVADVLMLHDRVFPLTADGELTTDLEGIARPEEVCTLLPRIL